MLQPQAVEAAESDANITTDETFKEDSLEVRKKIKKVAKELKVFSGYINEHSFSKNADVSEMAANLKLAYRHLEDASMRLGKAIQASDGGISVYDKESTVGT